MAFTLSNMAIKVWDQPTDHFSYAELATNWANVANHDHTTSKGVQIPTSGIADAAIILTKLATNSVDASKIIDGSIGIAELASTVVAAITPPGSIMLYGGATAPSGFLLCDGSTASRTGQAALFAVLGTTFNTGGESGTQFRLPDLRGKVPVGAGTGSGLTARALASSGGEETHLLSTTELPAHTHAFGTLATAASGAHTHPVSDTGHTHGNGTAYPFASLNDPSTTFYAPPATPGQVGAIAIRNVGIASSVTGISLVNSATHTHTLSGSTASVGTGATHNNMQPFLTVNYIVKT